VTLLPAYVLSNTEKCVVGKWSYIWLYRNRIEENQYSFARKKLVLV